MAIKTVFLLFVLTTCATAQGNYEMKNIKPGQNLAARLERNAGRVIECWNGLLQLTSPFCSNIIIHFFLTGQTNLSPECCYAVDIITRKCWPINLTSVGFTNEEGNKLNGYCAVSAPPLDAAVSPLPPVSDGLPPLPFVDSPPAPDPAWPLPPAISPVSG